MPASLNGLVPYLHVTDLPRSIAFYELLGLEVVGTAAGADGAVGWANLRRGDAWLMLAQGTKFDARRQAALLYAFHADVAALRDAVAASGLARHVGPIAHPDHMEAGELRLHDPDGYVVLVGQPPADGGHLAAMVAARTRAATFLEGVASRPVYPSASHEEIRAGFAGPLPEHGAPADEVVHALADAAEPGLVASAGRRYFGFVIGGSLPAALGADWLTAAWDQNAGINATSPAAAACEDVVAGWLLELLGLPAESGVGLVTGGQMANTTCLAAARHALYARAGWDVERDGLVGAPPLAILVGASAHATVPTALRLLGLGAGAAVRVEADAQGRMLPEALAAAVAEATGRPLLVIAQAGDVGSGAVDPLDAIADALDGHDAWLHVDGAFGLWAAASPTRRGLLAGHARADSWATDAHKWLNTPYDCGVALVRDRSALVGAFGTTAPYLVPAAAGLRNNMDTVPEVSRRARAFAVWAALRALGRSGVAELVDRTCDHARRAAGALAADPALEVLNEVVLNQVLVRVRGADDADGDRRTQAALAAVQASGEAWLGGTTWRGRAAMRISVSSWWTGEDDIDRLVAAIRTAAAAA